MPQQGDTLVDQMFQSDPKTGQRHYRVYYWDDRPDAHLHADHDRQTWIIDSEHISKELADKRAAELKKGAPKKSMMPKSASVTKLTKH